MSTNFWEDDDNFVTERKKTEHTNISSHHKKLRAQNIHVMFFYAIIPTKRKKPKTTSIDYCNRYFKCFWFQFDHAFLKKEQKKTEHTNISHSSQKTLHQNIHVMFSYAIIQTKTKHTKQHQGYESNFDQLCCFVSRR